MTTTAEPFVYVGTDHHRQAVEWLEQHPLPSADELAAPFLQGLLGLWRAFEDRADTLGFGVEHGEFLDRADEAIATAHRVASLVAMSVAGMLTGGSVSFGESARGVVLAICDAGNIENALYHAQQDRLTYGTE